MNALSRTRGCTDGFGSSLVHLSDGTVSHVSAENVL